MRFTELYIKNLKPTQIRYETREKASKGFAIRVFPNGLKSWLFLYTTNKRLRRMTLGNYPQVSLAQAREKYMDAYRLFKQGKDPGYMQAFEITSNNESITIEELINEYIEKWAIPRKKSWKTDKNMLEKDLEHWLKRKAKDITKREIILLLESIQKRAPILANRFLAVVRKMFNFAVNRDILVYSPCVGIKALSKEKRRDRVLSDYEIKEFWNHLQCSKLVKHALRLQLVLSQRSGSDILQAEWSEVDLESKWWNLPWDKTKNDEPNRLPLTDLACSILNEVKELRLDSNWVFPSPDLKSHIKGASLSRAIKRNINKGPLAHLKKFTPHDLRRTAATNLGALGVNRLVMGKILNHVDRSTTGIYDRYRYDVEKKDALDKWNEKLMTII